MMIASPGPTSRISLKGGYSASKATLSDANAFIAVPEGESDLPAGAEVTVVVLERRYI
jgi:molybdopterin biosynthesis enzyme